jgi:hypothetical protein
MSNTDFEQAERLSRKRARMLAAVAIIFIAQQGAFMAEPDAVVRTVDHVKVGAWVILSAVILAALITGGMWIYPRRIRDLANDESTRANRDRALRLGFVTAMVSCLILYVLSAATDVGTREAIHIIATVGLATALLRFAFLERQDQRGA